MAIFQANVHFRAPFQSTPTLKYGLYFFDSSKLANLRLHADATNISRSGFQITMKSWADSVYCMEAMQVGRHVENKFSGIMYMTNNDFFFN